MKPDFIKIWVDDRRGTKKTADAGTLHARSPTGRTSSMSRSLSNNVTLADAKELLRAGVEGLASRSRPRRRCRDDEIVGIVKDRIARNDRPVMWITLSLITSWANTAGGTMPAWARRSAAAGDLCAGADREILGRPAQERWHRRRWRACERISRTMAAIR